MTRSGKDRDVPSRSSRVGREFRSGGPFRTNAHIIGAGPDNLCRSPKVGLSWAWRPKSPIRCALVHCRVGRRYVRPRTGDRGDLRPPTERDFRGRVMTVRPDRYGRANRANWSSRSDAGSRRLAWPRDRHWHWRVCRFRVASDACPIGPRSSFSIAYSADDGTDDFRGRDYLPDEACLAILEEPARAID